MAIRTGIISQFSLNPSNFNIPHGKPYSGIVTNYNRVEKCLFVKIDDESYPHFMEFYSNGTKYDINFQSNRLPYQLQHHSLRWFAIHHLFDLLIQNTEYQKDYQFKLDEQNEYEKLENLNNEQSQAVHSIIAGSYEIPFLLFGPPGKLVSLPS